MEYEKSSKIWEPIDFAVYLKFINGQLFWLWF